MSFADYLVTRNHLFTGRASTAIYLALQANQVRGARVLVPANVCYAAVLPIVYSGNEPVFADVGEDGNLTSAAVRAAWSPNVRAAIIPHMYGNPCRDIDAICRTARAQGAIVIEDCASAMGAMVGGTMTGTFGDYAVFSFGYSKTIDCGYGGLIVSQHDLSGLGTMNAKLPPHEPSVDMEAKLFSQVYRVLRNNPAGPLADTVYEFMRLHMQSCFLFRAPDEQVDRIVASIGTLEEVIDRRRERAHLYGKLLNWSLAIKPYAFHSGAVPWRYNIVVDADLKRSLTAELLRQRLRVSDWYPVVAPMFGVHEPFPQAHKMEEQLLNLPLVEGNLNDIYRSAASINEYLASR
jgi:dTDP-4-amino-4,6-dideoxygalactose transaminase